MSGVKCFNPDHDHSETVVFYEDEGKLYEIDHLGIAYQVQEGDYAVYCDGKQISAFSVEFLEPTDEFLIKLAKASVAEAL